MIDLILIQEIALAGVIVLCFILGFGILLTDRSNPKNQTYLAISLSIVLWNLSGYLVYYHGLADYATLLGRLNFFSVGIFFIAVYGFVYHFPDRQKYISGRDRVFIAIGLLLSLISLITPLIVKKIVFDPELAWQMGSLVWIYYIYALLTTIIVFARLIKKYLAADDKDKTKVRLFFWGLGFVAVFNITFNIVWASLRPSDNIYWLGDYSVIFLLGFTAYAITHHQMFNIKLIATQTAVFAISILLLVETFVLNSNITELLLKFIVWLLATVGGWQLIKSVKHEIQQREQLAKLAKDLKEANEHLKEIDKLKDDFLSMASHELNTPIAAIEGYLSMILQEGLGGKIPPKAREYLESVFQSSQRLAHLVKDLLNVSRIESNRIHIIYEEKQIEDVIDQSIMEVMSKAKEAKHALTFEKPKKQLPKTWLDITRITEILINILGNAIKYTPDGGKIVVKATSDDKKIIVAVQDNGKGIPKEREKAVFEKFSQVDVMKDEVKGTGLGMYIAKKFIELMKGQIWFHSDGANKGTTFYFSLPVLDKKPFDPNEGEGEVLH